MDEMRIRSNFLLRIVDKLIMDKIKSISGIDATFEIHNIGVTRDDVDGLTRIDLPFSVLISDEELNKLITKLGY